MARLRFSNAQRNEVGRSTLERRCEALAQEFKKIYPDQLAEWSVPLLRDRFIRCADRMARYGIHQQEYLVHIFDWDLRCGEGFETTEAFRDVHTLLRSTKREPLKFDSVRNAMETHHDD